MATKGGYERRALDPTGFCVSPPSAQRPDFRLHTVGFERVLGDREYARSKKGNPVQVTRRAAAFRHSGLSDDLQQLVLTYKSRGIQSAAGGDVRCVAATDRAKPTHEVVVLQIGDDM